MNIREIERLTDISWKNIRESERRGFITPSTNKDGSINYSEEDVEILLRIKLLYKLYISLEELGQLKDGEYNLEYILTKHMTKLKAQKQDVDIIDICSRIREQESSFDTLNAKIYLDRMERTAKKTRDFYIDRDEESYVQVFHPWRRYFARALDIFLYAMICDIAIGFGFNENMLAENNVQGIMSSILALGVMVFAEPLLLHLFGTTLGKAIFGLRVVSADGNKLSYNEALLRTWGVLGQGMGYNIPIYDLVRYWKSYKLCAEGIAQPWDDYIQYTIKDTKWYRTVVYIGAHLLIIGVFTVAAYTQYMPPNRGDLTVVEFAENYNYYAKLLDIEFGDKYLTEEGIWDRKITSTRTYVSLGYNERPEYQYTIESGYVEGISFNVEVTNGEQFIYPYEEDMLLISWAYVGAQDEIGLFSEEQKWILANIMGNNFMGFELEEAGVGIDCDIEHKGYAKPRGGILIPYEDQDENSFRLDFNLYKK